METNKITFATLKKYARRGELLHQVEGEHGPYGMEYYRNGNELPLCKTTIEDLATFKATRNWITEGSDVVTFATLSNCVYLVNFYLGEGK